MCGPAAQLLFGKGLLVMVLTRIIKRYMGDSKYSEWRYAYLFMAVDLTWSVLFLLYPLVRAVQFSLQHFTLSNVANPTYVGLQNYIAI